MIGTDYADLIQAYEGDGMRSDKSSDAEEVVREAHCSEGLFMIQVIVSPDVKADIASFSDNFFKFINAGKSWSCSVPSRSNGCGRRSKELGENGAKISLGRSTSLRIYYSLPVVTLPGKKALNMMKERVDDRQALRPTEAQLRWAQFHRKTRAQHVHEKLERLYQTPAYLSDVPDALSEDGATTDSSAGSPKKQREKPRISRGRRAMLRVSMRNYERRRISIQENGFQCSDDKENEIDNDEKEDALISMFAEEAVRKKHRKRRQSRRHRAEDEEQRFRRFEAAYHAMMMNMMPQEQPELTPSKRWTRASHVPVAVSIDGRQYDDLKWGFTGRKATAVRRSGTATPSSAPFDRRASWLVHLPPRHESSRRLSFAPALSSDGKVLEPENGYGPYDESADFFSPGQMKFDELVARLRLREFELVKAKGQEGTPLGQREAQGKAAKFRQKYSHRHSADRMEDADLSVDGEQDPSFPATDIYGFPRLDDGSPDGQFSEADSDFWRRARNMHDTVPAGMASEEYLRSIRRGQDYQPRNEMSDSCLEDGSLDEQFSEAESDFWRRARNMHETVPAGMASEEYLPSTLQRQDYEQRKGMGAHDFGPFPVMVSGEHPYSTLRRQLAAEGHPHSVLTSDSETSPSDNSSEQRANLRASGTDSIEKHQIQYMSGLVGSADHDAPSAVPKLPQHKLKPEEPSLSTDGKKGAFQASNADSMVKRRIQDMDKPAGSADYNSPTAVPKLSQEKLELFEEMPDGPRLLADETKRMFGALVTDSKVNHGVDDVDGPACSADHDSPSAVPKLSQEKLGPFKAMSDEPRLSTDGAKAALRTSGTASVVRRHVQGMDEHGGSADHSPSAAPKLANEEFQPFEKRDESIWSPGGSNSMLKRRIYELGDPNLDSPSSLSEAVPKVQHEKLDQMKEILCVSTYSADDAEERLVGQREAGAPIESSQTLVSDSTVRQRQEEMHNYIGKKSKSPLAGPVTAAKLFESKLEPSEKRPAASRISSKVEGMFNSMFGSKKENDLEELRAVAAFRKTQDERRALNDDTTSTSSFRVLPEGIRRVVKNFATPKGKFSAIQPENDVNVRASRPEHGTLQQARISAAGFSTRSHSGTNREDFSPEHGRFMHQRVMEHSILIGDLDGDATIIDTDGTTSDASVAKMDPKIAATLFLSPTILTKRLHQAIRSIERHNWEQLAYLLNANPWLAEMADVTTGQYLLHKLALYGAGVAVMHPDTGDVVRVEAPAAPEELSFNLIRMFPASVHKFDQDGNLPLHMAAVSGNQEMCRFLGERFPSGASVRNEEGLLPLHMAIQSCSSPAPSADGTITSPSEIVKTILGFFPGAVAVADNDGNLPIHCAASALHGELGVDIIFMLLDEADNQVQNGLIFRVTESKTYDDDTETVATDLTATVTELSADDFSYCNLVRNKLGHTPLETAVRSKAGWEIIEAIACGPGGKKAALLPDANMSNVLHLLVSGEFADAASILSVLKIAPQAAAARNSEGMLPIEIACMQVMPREVILALVLVDLPIDLDEKAGIKVREGFGGSWCYLTCECDDHYADAVEEVISICSYPQVRELCFAKCGPSGNGGSVISRATPKCRLALRKALRFVERFEFLGTVALHTDVSLGVKVFEALDFGTADDGFEDGRRVLLRCYSREKTYLQETSVVREYRFDTSYVEDLFEFGVHEQDDQSSEVTPQQYCVAIELPSLTLDRVVVSMFETDDYKRNPDMRDRYFSKVCMVLRLIAKSIRHLHEVGVVHGDVCLENCGKFEDKWKLMSSLGMQPIGKRFDAARMGESSPPEAVEMLHNVVETRGQETSSRHATFKGDIVAGPAVDIWAFGKLIYEALTGEPLIRFDSNKDTRYDNRALLKLVSWNEGDLRNVVNSLEDSGVSTLGVDLVSHCLLPDPSERPSTMDEILDHPFWKDMRRKGVMARRSNNKGQHEI